MTGYNNSSCDVDLTLSVTATANAKNMPFVDEKPEYEDSDFDEAPADELGLYMALAGEYSQNDANDPVEFSKAIDPETGKVEQTITLDGKPDNFSITSDTTKYQYLLNPSLDGLADDKDTWNYADFKLAGAVTYSTIDGTEVAPVLTVAWSFAEHVDAEITYDGPTDALWLGKTETLGLSTSAFTASDVSSVTLEYIGAEDKVAPLEVKSKCHIEQVDGSYWVWVSVPDTEELGMINELGTYKMVVTLNGVRYVGSITF
jgi:hypothetical protein